jgi:hypothetical protein
MVLDAAYERVSTHAARVITAWFNGVFDGKPCYVLGGGHRAYVPVYMAPPSSPRNARLRSRSIMFESIYDAESQNMKLPTEGAGWDGRDEQGKGWSTYLR